MIVFDLANTVDPKHCRPERQHLSGSSFFAKVTGLHGVTGFTSGLNMGLNFSMLEILISLCGRLLFVFLQNRRFQITTYH